MASPRALRPSSSTARHGVDSLGEALRSGHGRGPRAGDLPMSLDSQREPGAHTPTTSDLLSRPRDLASPS